LVVVVLLLLLVFVVVIVIVVVVCDSTGYSCLHVTYSSHSTTPLDRTAYCSSTAVGRLEP
jgi:hypothetical protein